jgi:hypothetical protein
MMGNDERAPEEEPRPDAERVHEEHEHRLAGQGWGAGGYGADPVRDDHGYGDAPEPDTQVWGAQGFVGTEAASEVEDELGEDQTTG